MNKNELIGSVADASGLSRSDATKAVEAVFDTVSGALSKGDEVRLVGFGTFSVAKRKASTGRNPRTGEPMTIKASSQPKIKAGKGLKDSCIRYAAIDFRAASPRGRGDEKRRACQWLARLFRLRRRAVNSPTGSKPSG